MKKRDNWNKDHNKASMGRFNRFNTVEERISELEERSERTQLKWRKASKYTMQTFPVLGIHIMGSAVTILLLAIDS